MRFKEYIVEKRSKNVIVVDVQPMYSSSIRFNISDFCDFLIDQRDILYFYNGPDTVGSDTKNNIMDWLTEEYYGDIDILDQKLSNAIWYDKGYAFFRSWMDQGADVGFIKKAIRFMMKNKVYDSREIDPEVWEEKFPNEWDDYMIDDPIYIPDIPINKLKKFSNGYIVGGGKNECLQEIQILMSVFNIKATEIKRFIY
jgi:hypothetical protein